MSQNFQPGEMLQCTITRLPKATDTKQTLLRLMRLDPGTVRSLRKAQRTRRQNQVVYNRGNRDWFMRRSPAQVVQLAPGATWKLRFNLNLADDMKLAEPFISVAKA